MHQSKLIAIQEITSTINLNLKIHLVTNQYTAQLNTLEHTNKQWNQLKTPTFSTSNPLTCEFSTHLNLF